MHLPSKWLSIKRSVTTKSVHVLCNRSFPPPRCKGLHKCITAVILPGRLSWQGTPNLSNYLSCSAPSTCSSPWGLVCGTSDGSVSGSSEPPAASLAWRVSVVVTGTDWDVSEGLGAEGLAESIVTGACVWSGVVGTLRPPSSSPPSKFIRVSSMPRSRKKVKQVYK